MNYTQDIVQDFPYDNPLTKIACAMGVLWIGYVAIGYSKRTERLPERRKHKQAFGLNQIDKQLDSKNRALGGKVPSNPDVPFYSRQNYNRRRRGMLKSVGNIIA